MTSPNSQQGSRAAHIRLETEIRQLEGEVERLREALEAIIDGGWNQDGMVAVAKTALGRTPVLQQEEKRDG